MLNTPVLFLIFNRPDLTEFVFNKIRKIRPKRLYIAADGPRNNIQEDIETCNAARKIATNVNWDCEVKTFLRDTNIGCGLAVSGAVSWFFQNEESGIILEDDCVPSESFFLFCQELLLKYKGNERIMHINGNNFNIPISRLLKHKDSSSYYFGSFAQVWGWASWRRAWEKYDFKINTWANRKVRRTFITKFPSVGAYLERYLDFNLVYEGKIDTWDFQWQYAILLNDGFVIIPKANLVSNIGYGSDSAHMKVFDKNRNNLETKNIDFPLKHPLLISKMKKLDYLYSLKMGMRPKLKNIHRCIFSYLRTEF